MKYLMIRKDDKNYPLAITRGNKNGLTFQTDNGEVSARLVPTTSAAATSLRMKINDEIKSVAAMQSLLLPRVFYSRTGSDLQAPSPRSDYIYYSNIVYDTMNGIFYARQSSNPDFNTGTWGKIINSNDGINWEIHEYNCLYGDFIPLYYGMLSFEIESVYNETYHDGTRDLYIKFNRLSLSGVGMWDDSKILLESHFRYWNEERPVIFENFCVKKAEGPMEKTIGILDYAILIYKEGTYEQRSYYSCVIEIDITNIPMMGSWLSFRIASIIHRPTAQELHLSKHFYNPKLKTFGGVGPNSSGSIIMGGSYDGITWSEDIPAERSSHLINGYVYLPDKKALSLDGKTPAIYTTEHINGYDPVDQKYINISTSFTGKQSPRIIVRVLSSSDCTNWTEELRLPSDTYINDVGHEEAFNYSEELGFVSS